MELKTGAALGSAESVAVAPPALNESLTEFGKRIGLFYCSAASLDCAKRLERSEEG